MAVGIKNLSNYNFLAFNFQANSDAAAFHSKSTVLFLIFTAYYLPILMFCSKPQLQPKSLSQKPCLLYLSNWYDYTAWLRTDLQPTNSYCKSSLHYLMGVYWNSFEWSNKVFALLLSFLFEQTNSQWSYLDRVAIKQTKHMYPPLYLQCISLAT